MMTYKIHYIVPNEMYHIFILCFAASVISMPSVTQCMPRICGWSLNWPQIAEAEELVRAKRPQPRPEPSRSPSPEPWAKRESHRAAGVAFVKRSADYRAVIAHGPSSVARPQTPDPGRRSGKRTWERGMQDWRKALTHLVNLHNLIAPAQPEDVDDNLRTAVRTALVQVTP